MCMMCICISLASALCNSSQFDSAEIQYQRERLFRHVNDQVTEDNANSVNFFKQLFHENVEVFVHRGCRTHHDQTTAGDTQPYQTFGIPALLETSSKWYKKNSAATTVISDYYTVNDHISFITGSFEFVSPVSEDVAIYMWVAKAEWYGMKIVRYDLHADFTLLENELALNWER